MVNKNQQITLNWIELVKSIGLFCSILQTCRFGNTILTKGHRTIQIYY